MTDSPTPTTQWAPAHGAEIAFDVTGSGPAVLLLHAGLGDRTMWDAQLPAFAPEFTVIRVDARGFGETVMPPSAYASTADLLAVLDQLNVARAHVIGVSMGSQTAIELAVVAPERVASLTAVAARAGEPVSPELRAGWDHVNALVEAGDIDGAVEYELRMWVDGPGRTPEMVDATVRERARALNAALFTRTDTEGEEIDIEPPVAERLGEITVPTLVVYGDQDIADVLIAGPKLAAAIPGARLVVLPDTAHLPQLERPAAFNEVVLEFLRGV